MNLRRKALVDTAFGILDKNGHGVIEPEDLVGFYDASKHPDVLSGLELLFIAYDVKKFDQI